MKKSSQIVLTSLFVMSIASCRQNNSWIRGDQGSRDTISNGSTYRSYGGRWYPVYNGMISPTSYQGSSQSDISRPGYAPSRTSSFSAPPAAGTHSGGFGSSAASHSGGAGE